VLSIGGFTRSEREKRERPPGLELFGKSGGGNGLGETEAGRPSLSWLARDGCNSLSQPKTKGIHADAPG